MSEKIATREAYGKALVELGAANEQVVVLDADLAGATMTKHFKAAYPQRFFDCGIAEADMMNIAAGLSTMGLVPFCSTFAMFGAGRAYEQIRNSIAYPKFNVKICCSHAGVSVGEDGGSHQAIEDIGLMRLIPGMTVIVPADAKESRKATLALAEFRGPAYMRLARLATPVFEEDYPFEIGKANVLREGTDAAVFACGLMVSETLAAARLLEAQGIRIAVINVHTIKPIDAACVTQWAEKCGNVVTVEEHSVIGGLGDAVADVLMGKVSCKFRKIGVNDRFGQSGKAADVLREYGFDSSNCVITSQSYETLCKVKELDPEIETGYILALGVGTYYDLPAADFFSVESTFITSGMVQQIHLRGKTVSAWTVNRAEDARDLLSLGVDDVITDKPEMVQDLLNEDADLDRNLVLMRDRLKELLGLTESADSEVDPDDSAIEEVLEDPEELLDQA